MAAQFRPEAEGHSLGTEKKGRSWCFRGRQEAGDCSSQGCIVAGSQNKECPVIRGISQKLQGTDPLMDEPVTTSFLVLGRIGEVAVESADKTTQFEVSFVHFLFIQACAYRRNTFMYQA